MPSTASALSGRLCTVRKLGAAQADSDYDVAVFLNGMNGASDRWTEADKIAVAATRILNETGAVIHATPHWAGAYLERTPLMHELRREGLDL
jgi:NAD dependent epimerase/dehydratase family enzyme